MSCNCRISTMIPGLQKAAWSLVKTRARANDPRGPAIATELTSARAAQILKRCLPARDRVSLHADSICFLVSVLVTQLLRISCQATEEWASARLLSAREAKKITQTDASPFPALKVHAVLEWQEKVRQEANLSAHLSELSTISVRSESCGRSDPVVGGSTADAEHAATGADSASTGAGDASNSRYFEEMGGSPTDVGPPPQQPATLSSGPASAPSAGAAASFSGQPSASRCPSDSTTMEAPQHVQVFARRPRRLMSSNVSCAHKPSLLQSFGDNLDDIDLSQPAPEAALPSQVSADCLEGGASSGLNVGTAGEANSKDAAEEGSDELSVGGEICTGMR